MLIRFEHRHSITPMESRHFKGGDGGAADLRADEAARQAKVQAAVNAINTQFGKGQQRAAPTQDQFMVGGAPAVAAREGYSESWGGGDGDNYRWVPPVAGSAGTPAALDQAGYDRALASWQTEQAAPTQRQALYDSVSNDTRDVALRDIDRQFGQASKNNTFGLARAGLMGGSVDAEAGGDLGERYAEGRIKATQAGVNAAADLESTDEKTRQNLISLAQSGIDTGTASSLAAGQMASAAESARSATAGASVGRLFDDMGQAYLMQRVAAAGQPGAPQQSTGSSYFGNLFSGKKYTGS